MQKLLIIGGTRFIGQNLLAALLPLQQWDITLFNRGLTNPGLFPKVKRLIGDRYTEDIKILNQEHWDYIIDLSCYYPGSIDLISQHLKKKPKRYIYLSSISSYQVQGGSMQSEDLFLKACTADQKTDTSDYSYGNRMAECDRLIEKWPGDYIILRPSIVYGAQDYTDRFYYWLYQIKTRSEVLIPEDGQRVLALTYVQDLVQILIESLELENPGKAYNIISHPSISIRQIVEEAGRQLGRSPDLIAGPADFLLAHQIDGKDLPLWIRNDYYTFSDAKMKADYQSTFSGLTENMAATLAYYDGLGWPAPICGLSVEKQDHLIGKLGKLDLG